MHRTIKTTGIKLLVLLGATQALVAGLGFAQQAPLAPLKPLKKLLGPEEKLRGTWWSENAYGREYFTFGEKRFVDHRDASATARSRGVSAQYQRHPMEADPRGETW